ncbi:tight adherence protein E [Enterobacter asburiae]|uniref:TadE/TadG family type IV pilus assembly protein n=1 Tax=Enterobacter asburiae TaxID=61645 RepID=UPI00141A9A40|nr:TadE family protein [Enterobacter asburiae]NIH92220.1 tight adherence protein E [Enterobacter asburiae]
MHILNRFYRQQRGVVTIEFALTVTIFLFMVLFIAEMSRMAYVSSTIDLAVSEAAKAGKNAPQNNHGYEQRYRNILTKQGGALWFFLTDEDAVEMSIHYARSIDDMVNTGGIEGHSHIHHSPLARYHLLYHYHPMFFPFPKSLADPLFNREVIFVQEYERSQFMD